jgi:hypothetical protein
MKAWNHQILFILSIILLLGIGCERKTDKRIVVYTDCPELWQGDSLQMSLFWNGDMLNSLGIIVDYRIDPRVKTDSCGFLFIEGKSRIYYDSVLTRQEFFDAVMKQFEQ